jgi:2',3'-cyclic-nucleotide 2'-phosphodiesterase (5'-nucleotidase family)
LAPLAFNVALLGAPPALSGAASQGITGALADDPALAKVVDPLITAFHASFGQPLVEAPGGLARGRGDANPLGFWVADIMLERARGYLAGVPVRAAFTNNGGLRKNLAPGMVRLEDLYELIPFENQLVVAEYTGAEIRRIVQETIRYAGGEPFAGILATLDGTPDQPRLTVAWSDGAAIEPEASYRLATTDYLVASGGGTTTVMAGRKVIFTGLSQRQLLVDECERLAKARAPLLPPPAGRYRLPPELLQAAVAGSGSW